MNTGTSLGWRAAFSRFGVDLLLCTLLIGWGLWRQMGELSHDSIWNYDESFHQVVTRHTFDHPLAPTLYDDPVSPSTDPYFDAREWLIKPPGAFWFGALMMHLVGPVPLAFRLGGALSQLLAALVIFAAARALSGRLWATLASASFLALPAGWVLTQAHFIGDQLDLQVCGCICLALVFLFISIERSSIKWGVAAGVVTGVGILVKSVLALTPLGIAGVLWGLSRVRFCPGPRGAAVGAMAGATVLVAAPWNLYAATRWPHAFLTANADLLTHLFSSAAAVKAPQWQRPVDAVFNEINRSLFEPMPHGLVLLIGGWLAFRAISRRELLTVGAALWLWATWIGHSLVAVKIYSHLWNVVVPASIGLALVLEDVWKHRGLALAVVGGAGTPLVVARFPGLEHLRTLLPAALVQTRVVSGLVEGLVVMGAAALVGWGSWRLVRHDGVRYAAGLAATVALCWVTLWRAPARQDELAKESERRNDLVYAKAVGQALEASTEQKSLLLLDVDFDPPASFESHNLMFWSDRLVRGGRDPRNYPQAGYHPYVVSAAAVRFAPVAAVPGYAWLRAFDLRVPLSGPPPLPPDVQPLDLKVGNLRVLGFAHQAWSRRADHYAFYVRAEGGPPGELPVAFRTAQGVEEQVVQPEGALQNRGRLATADWFVMPVVGPPHSTLEAIEVGAERQRIAIGGAD